MKIVVTGGHLTPALATMEAIKAKRSGVEFHFLGRMHTREGDTAPSAEYTLMKEKQVPFYPVTTGRLQRSFTQYTIPSLLKIPLGLFQSFQYLHQIKPDVVLSFGGYLAVPVAIAAWILGIPVVSHEQTLVPGLANQIISKFATVLALSFEETEKHYPHAKTVVTGNPIRADIFEKKGNFVLDKRNLPVLFITGGNQGSHVINQAIFRLLTHLLPIMHVIHQTGNAVSISDYQDALSLEKEYEGKFEGKYVVFDYIGPDKIGDVFGYADILVSRAGINILSDIFALGKKAVIIPIPKTSNNEQGNNAEFFAKTGLGIALSQNEMTDEKLFDSIHELVGKQISPEVVSSARSHVRLDAAQKLADVVLSLQS